MTPSASRMIEQLRDAVYATESPIPRHGRMGSLVTMFSSRKNASVIACESLLEAAFCLELERRTDVVDYETHPCTLNFIGTRYRYTPDFLVCFADGSQRLVEVKNDQSYSDKATSARITRYSEILAEHGCMLEYLAASHFFCRTRSLNLAFLYQQAFVCNGESTNRLRALMDTRQSPMSIGQLLHLNFLPSHIAHAIFYGSLDIDLSQKITSATPVHITQPMRNNG